MANIVLDFLHNYQTGERRESEPATAYQYDEGHVLEAVLPEVITSCEIHYWIRGMEDADAYTPTSITPNSDGSCTVLGNIPNSYFETNGELRIYIVVTDGTASITTYEGKLHIAQRAMPDDYVDDDPENEAVRVITEARAAAATATEKAGEAAESAEQAQEILDSIPEDYTQLSEDVSNLKDDLTAVESDVTDLKDGLNWQNEVLLADAAPTNYKFVVGGVNGGDGSENTSTGRAKTDFIPYVNDELIVEADDDYLISIAYYDANKTWLISHWWYGSPYTIKGYSRNEIQNTAYIKIVLKRADDGAINIDDVNAKVKVGRKGNYLRTYTVEQDGSGDFSSLVDAIYVAEEHMGSTVYVGNGVWDIISDLGSTYISNVSATQRGIYLKNRIKVVCSSNCLISAIYDGSRALTARWLSIFNAGQYGFTLENVRLSGKNIRYCVHDERDSDTDAYVNSYINCRMILDNSENTHTSAVQCIGGGLGLYGVINIDSCFFYSVNSQDVAFPAVSYHNTADVDNKNGRSLIFINDCYFENNNTVRICYYGNSTNVSYALVTNNWLGRDVIYGPETNDSSSSNVNITVTKWNNRIRNMDDDGTITSASSSISFDPNFSSLTAKNGIAILTFLINGVNLTTSNQHIATLSYKPTKRTIVVIYDKSSGSIAEGYVDLDGKLYSKAYTALSGTNLRGSCSFVIA